VYSGSTFPPMNALALTNFNWPIWLGYYPSYDWVISYVATNSGSGSSGETTNTMLKSVYARSQGQSNQSKVDHAYYADESYLAQQALSAVSATTADSATTALMLENYAAGDFLRVGQNTFDLLLNGSIHGQARSLHLQGDWAGVSNVDGVAYITAPTVSGQGAGTSSVNSEVSIYSSGSFIGTVTGMDFNAQFGVTITAGIARIAGVPAGTLPNYPVSIFTNKAPYTYTGSDQFFVVPGNVTSVLVKAWGGAGGGSGNIAGGNGGYAQAIIPVVPLETLIIRVGGGGVCGTIQPSGPTCTNNVFGGGGYHSITNNMFGFQRASGGGATWVFRVASGETVPYPLTTNDLTNVTVLVVAGGGGGASSHGNAGLGGGLAGGNSLNGGFGGTQDAGGVPATVGSNSVAGTFAFAQQLGTNSYTPMAAGGGGWHGGASGGTSGASAYAGGGGAAHLDISCLGFTFANNFAFEEDWSTGIGVGLLSGQSGPGKAVVRY
jgi:hypothetical protein